MMRNYLRLINVIILLCISRLLGQTINIITSEDLSSGSIQTFTEALQGRLLFLERLYLKERG